jgi:multiple sugar transport system permease protein
MRSQRTGILVATFVAFAVVFFLFPILWVVITSFKAPADVMSYPPALLFSPPLENYPAVFERQPFVRYLMNSIVVTALSTVMTLIVGTLAGYSLARLRVRGKRHITFALMLAKMFPPIILVLPFFVLLSGIGLTNNLFALALTYTSFNLPFITWILWSFFRDLPDGLEEAAITDGCTRFGAMWRVMLPLARPGIAVAAIFTASVSWNEFLFALNLMGPERATLPVMASNFVTVDGILWGPVTAVGTLLMIPMFALTFALQRHLVAGLTGGALK